MKTSISEFTTSSKLIRQNEVYSVYDLKLEDLTVSMTVLHVGKETTGHAHPEAEEVYIFLEGEGEMQVADEKFAVKKDDLVTIPKGAFHKVFNKGEKDLVLLCIFEKYGVR